MFRFDFFTIAAFATGAIIPVQVACNAQLGQATRNPYSAGFIIFIVGLLASLIVLFATRTPLPRFVELTSAPITIWLGGIITAIYMVSIVSLASRLGVGTITMLILAGQIFMALFIEHFGVFGSPQHPVSLQRICGGGGWY